MNSKHHKLVAAAVLASAIVTAGCSADMFNQANTTLKTIQTAGKAVGNVRIPAAAVASALGGLEIVKALSADGTEAKKSGIIAAGSGNIIAAGGGNIIAAGGGNYDLLALDLNKEVTKKLTENGVNATLKYSSKLDGNSLVSSIQSFVGNTNGYDIDLSGAEFIYFISSNGSGGRVEFGLKKPATLVKPAPPDKPNAKPFTATIKTLRFATQDPMPDNYGYIGEFSLSADDDGTKVEMNAELGIKDKKVVVYATIKTTDASGKSESKEVRFGQDNPSFTNDDLDDAEKLARKQDDDARAKAKAEAQAARDERDKAKAAAAPTT